MEHVCTRPLQIVTVVPALLSWQGADLTTYTGRVGSDPANTKQWA